MGLAAGSLLAQLLPRLVAQMGSKRPNQLNKGQQILAVAPLLVSTFRYSIIAATAVESHAIQVARNLLDGLVAQAQVRIAGHLLFVELLHQAPDPLEKTGAAFDGPRIQAWAARTRP